MGMDVAETYRRYGPMVLRRCRTLLKDEDLALDAMHDVFVELLRRPGLDVASHSSYLYRSATHVCLNRIRSRRRKPLDGDDELLARIAAAPDDRATARLRLERLFRGEAPSTRIMATLHLVDGLTLEEVAAECGLSVSGVRKRLRTLRAHVAELEGSAP